MSMLAMLWASSPGETGACLALAAVCAAGMAMLIGLLAWPADPEKMEE